MAKPVFTVVIDINGTVSIIKKSKVPFLNAKGTSIHKAVKIMEAIND